MNKNYYTNILEPLLTGDVEAQREFLRAMGVIKRSLSCVFCATPMKKTKCDKIKDKEVFKCQFITCEKRRTTRSIRSESFLSDISIELKDVIKVLWKFSNETQVKDIVEEVGCSKNGILHMYVKLRHICTQFIANKNIQLGGPGAIVQIDESMFRHKPKYHRGRATEKELWVFGIADTRYVPSKIYMEVVENRSAKFLLPIINNHVLPGSIIFSDMWRAYNSISDDLFTHATVNHSLHFVDPETHIHTQNIESNWAKQKGRIKKMKGVCGNNLHEHLAVFMWWDMYCKKDFFKILELIRQIN